jgi:hypothetical protein
MKAVAELSKIVKRKPAIIAKHEHEIRNLQPLMDTTGANGAIPTLPRVSETRMALPRVQQAATLPRVPTDARGHLNESPATTMPIDARRRLYEPPATTMPTTHTVRTNAPPEMTTQPVPSKPCAPRSSKNHQPSTTGGTRTRSMIARDTAHAALPASQTCLKTEAANATQQQFKKMENEVHQALAVIRDWKTPQLPATTVQPKAQESMEYVSSQRVWLPGSRSWRTNQRHQHNQVHPPT